MNRDLSQDLVRTHSITNYLWAGYQGQFTFLNILAQLRFETLDPAAIPSTKEALEKIQKWNSDIAKGLCLFSNAWTKPETFDAQKAVEYLTLLRAQLNAIAAMNMQILSLENPAQNDENLKFLVASFGRYAYGRDNYVRGFIEYGKSFGLEDVVNQYNQHLVAASEDLRLAHSFLSEYKDPAKRGEYYVQNLTHHCLRLPGIFRSQAHDITLLLAPFMDELTYIDVGIPPEVGELWQSINISPFIAGYWWAHFIPPQEAIAWQQAGIPDCATVTEWRILGFTPETATPWYGRSFPPMVAAIWKNAGYDPEGALKKIERGITFPEER